jgi:hypothetical protein
MSQSENPLAGIGFTIETEADAERMWEMIEERERRALPYRERFIKAGIPVMTAIVMAGDYVAADAAEELLRSGELTWLQAVTLCGSYSRPDAALRWQEAGFATRDELLDEWPWLWSGGDPDDTDPRFLVVWRELRERTGDVAHDGEPLEGETFTVYRGQPPGAPLGLSWSLDREVAQRFAKGAAFRGVRMNGEVLTDEVPRERVLAYLTGRGEAEVVVDQEEEPR